MRESLREYQTWSLRGRGFWTALALSLAWHFFWFFAITVVVTPEKHRAKKGPRVVSLGPVLDDELFRTLLESRPQLSETFYRDLESTGPPLEPPVERIEKSEPGDVVSVPYGRRFVSSLKGLLGDDKSAPDTRWPSEGPPERQPEVAGALAGRAVIDRPEPPVLTFGLDPSLRSAEVDVAVRVDPSGSVVSAEVLRSSGDPEIDALWVRYVRRWHFAPAPGSKEQDGRIRLGFARAGE